MKRETVKPPEKNINPKISRLKAAFAVIAAAAAICAALAHAVPLPAKMSARHSTFLVFRDGSPMSEFLSGDDKWRISAKLDKIDERYVRSLVKLEDRRFYWHPGVDPLSVVRAIAQNLKAGKIVSGASTITMQLVRVLEPRPRTVFSKFVEGLRALQLEIRFSKKEILEMYLSYIPFGRNIEGVSAASLAFFGRDAKVLSPAEAAVLLAVPQNPNVRYPSKANYPRLYKAREKTIKKIILYKTYDTYGKTPDLKEELASPLPDRLLKPPSIARHAAVWISGLTKAGDYVKTSLDRNAQIACEKIVAAYKEEWADKGIYNVAVALIDNESGKIAALIGSFDFDDDAKAGQIPAFLIPRSTGSALKPLILALAIDAGIALPSQLVPDAPSSRGKYKTRNYNNVYYGMATLKTALSQSLNAPFIDLLSRLGPEKLIGALRLIDAKGVWPDADRYGLSAAVGGVETSPLDMAALYSAFANGGRYVQPSWTMDETEARGGSGRLKSGVSIVSPEAVYLMKQALNLRDRPDFPLRRKIGGTRSDIYWKTGTSVGFKDAYSVGFTKKYSAAVWTGNLDNKPSFNLRGASASAPIMFDVLEALDDRGEAGVLDERPKGLGLIEVCAYSGFAPADACPRKTKTLAILEKTPTQTCPYHVKYDFDLDSGLALKPECRAGKRYESRVFAVLPAKARAYFNSLGKSYPKTPRFARDCGAAFSAKNPNIITPALNQSFALISGLDPQKQQIGLEAEVFSGTTTHWFLDGEYLGSAKEGDKLWIIPTQGEHTLVAEDDSGASSSRKFNVISD